MEQNQTNTPSTTGGFALHFDLGTFEGFNFRPQQAIDRSLTAQDVVNWDHDAAGEAEFWPSGDHAGLALLFAGQSAVTASQLLALDRLLSELGDDSTFNYLRIHYAVSCGGDDLARLTGEQVEDLPIHIFEGSSFLDLRKEAAFELFELYYPDEYRVWEKTQCDGLVFDPDRFLDSPVFSAEEIELTDRKALIVATA
jgi:hypothetical protein